MEQIQLYKLPEPELKGTLFLEEAIASRRSKRRFQTKALDLKLVSQLLWAAQGITDETSKLRAAPSSGALFPVELFIMTQEGFFHYVPDNHELELINSIDMRKSFKTAALNQEPVLQAPLSILIFADFSRVTQKYIHHGVKYVHMETGHIAQNILLQAAALDLGVVCIGAFDADEVKEIVPVAEELDPLYIMPVGYTQ